MTQPHTGHSARYPKSSPQDGGVSRAAFNALLARLDDIEDALFVLRAQQRGVDEDALPAAFARRLAGGESPLRIWREFRGMTLDRLSKTADVSKPYLSEVESGKKPGSVAFFKKCAAALGVALGDLTD